MVFCKAWIPASAGMIFLPLVCVFFVILQARTADALTAFTLDSVVTCDLSGTPTVFFNPGETVRYKASYTIEGPVALVLLSGVVEGTSFRLILPWQYGFLATGPHTTIWEAALPQDASGQAIVRITYLGFIDALATRQATFNITDADADPTEVGSAACSACHADISATLEDSAHGFIECEACHGPGSNHVQAPSSTTIFIDRSSALCGQCHSRGDSQHRVEAEGGLIKSNQQYDELLAGGKSSFKCVRCHDPHVSLQADPGKALANGCSSCHLETISQFHVAEGVGCIDCHMPYAVRTEAARNTGDNLKGDGRAHIFTISATARPYEMFYQQDGKTFTSGFLPLNFACLGCHDGSYGKQHDFSWALQAATLMHAE
jgi:hypothetical protein